MTIQPIKTIVDQARRMTNINPQEQKLKLQNYRFIHCQKKVHALSDSYIRVTG